MERLKRLCNFLTGMFSSSAACFFTMAVILRDVNYVIPGIAMACLCGIVVHNITKAEEEEGKDNKKEN